MHRYRAASLFQPTNLAGAIAQTMAPYSDTPYLYGSIMAFPHTMVARSVATLGMDFVMIDALHTSLDAENLTRLIQTINFCSEGKTVAVVRVPSASSHLLTHALDAGAGGIVFPHIDTAEQAADAVSRCRYASSGGERSLSPCALIPGITDLAPRGESHVTVADAHIAVICQIESPLALDNAAAIAATPGVASLMLGPGDLRLTLGLPPRRAPGVPAEPAFLEAIDRLVRVSERFRKPLMTVSFKTTTEDAWIAKFNILLTTADFFNVVQGHQQDLKAVRGLIEQVCGSTVNEAGMGGEVKAKMNGIKCHGKQGLSNGFKAN